MRKIVQIEELRYGRRESYDEAALDEMIECFKDDYEDELPQASLSPFYPLIERTIYQFDEGKLTGSERTFYLLRRKIRTQKYVEWYPDWNREAPTVYYDAKRDEYVVRHIRYNVDKNTPRFISQAMAEADYPRRSKDVQAPPEKTTAAPRPIPQPAPTPTPQPKPAPQPVYQPQDAHSHWRKSTLKKLGDLYQKGYSAKEIQEELKCSIDNIYYHLEHTLGYKTPFDPSVWLPRAKGGTSKPVVTQNPQPQPQPQTKPDRPVKEKHKGRYTWDGEIILTHLYKHPGATTSEIASTHKSLTRRDINQCLNNYFSGYVEKDKRTGGYRLNQRGINEIRPYIESLGTPEITLQDYQAMLQRLHRSKNAKGHIAPHKVILMLAIISYFKKHIVRVMEIDNDMKVFFMDFWRRYVHSDEWTPNIYMPWEHMTSEPFWHWVTEDSTTEAYLDDDLYYMIHHDKSARIALKNTLIEML